MGLQSLHVASPVAMGERDRGDGEEGLRMIRMAYQAAQARPIGRRQRSPNRPGINSVTLITGPANGINYGLPEEYDEEMTRHAKVMAEHGVALVDPFPQLQATDRPDRFHTSLTAENMNATVMWYRALISATVNRLINDMRPEMVANRREIVFYEHFHMNKPDARLMIPGLKDLFIRPTRDEELPPQARDDDEQIVMDVPLLSPQQDLLLTEGEEITEVDRILLDTTPGAVNVVQKENDDNSTPPRCSSRSCSSIDRGICDRGRNGPGKFPRRFRTGSFGGAHL